VSRDFATRPGSAGVPGGFAARPRADQSAGLRIDCGATDIYTITALAEPITSVTIDGVPNDGQKLLVRVSA
jgi:hypothetical protein